MSTIKCILAVLVIYAVYLFFALLTISTIEVTITDEAMRIAQSMKNWLGIKRMIGSV